MVDPLSLRLCCLAVMAPALTSEAASRARVKHSAAASAKRITRQNSLPNIKHTQLAWNKKINTSVGNYLSRSVCNNITTKSVGTSSELNKLDRKNWRSTPDISRLYHTEGLFKKHCPTDKKGQNQGCLRKSMNQPLCTNVNDASTSCGPGAQRHGAEIRTFHSGSAPVSSQTKTSSQGLVRDSRQGNSNSGATSSTVTNGGNILSFTRNMCQLDSQAQPSIMGGGSRSALHRETACQKGPLSMPSATTFGQSDKVGQAGISSQIRSSRNIQDSTTRQNELESRRERLMQRLRRLQTRQALSHVRQQVSGFVCEQQEHIEQVRTSLADAQNGVDLNEETMHGKNVKHLSTAALVNLVQKLQSSQPQTLHRHLSSGRVDAEPPQVLRLDEETCTEFDRVSGHLSMNLHHLENAVDSDGTESSSGGESCDEMDFDLDWDRKTTRPSVRHRADWKWAVERAAVAARWTWLQAQVSDLEYRIRQQNDIYRQIRASKGQVTLVDAFPAEENKGQSVPCARRLASAEEHQKSTADGPTASVAANRQSHTASLEQPLQSSLQLSGSGDAGTTGSSAPKVPKVIPNGYVDSTRRDSGDDSGQVKTEAGEAAGPDVTCQAARCRPLRSHRKRKLLRTSGLHHVSRKAARLSTVRCHCYPPVVPCAMCGGRYNNVMQLDSETMSLPERVALLDQSFHSVLSFTQDVPLSVHFEALLKTGEWQNKPVSKQIRQKRESKTKADGAKKYNKRIPKNASAVVLSSTKIKNKYDGQKQTRRDGLVSSPKKDRATERARTRLCRSDGKLRKQKSLETRNGSQHFLRSSRDRLNSTSSASGLRDSSPLSQSGSLRDIKEALRKKRGENAYDINNIVIPYSIAASTRVEKLQYKEILTPSWREIQDGETEENKPDRYPEPVPSTSRHPTPPPLPSPPEEEKSDSEVEDLSDETFTSRHLKCEIAERKKFATVVPAQQRRGRSSHSDSIESSQAHNDLTGSSLVSVTEDDQVMPPSIATMRNEDIAYYSRRRSSSVSRPVLRSRSSSHSEESAPAVDKNCQPWPTRTFPLNKDEEDALFNEDIQMLPTSLPQTPATKVLFSVGPDMPNCSGPPSPHSSSNSSVPDDPNDPEWTVEASADVSLVLKLTKR